MSNYDVIANQPVVIDNGSGVLKAGFAGDQIPKCHFSSFIGRPKHVRVMAGGLEGDMFIGPKAEEYRGLLKVGWVQNRVLLYKLYLFISPHKMLKLVNQRPKNLHH